MADFVTSEVMCGFPSRSPPIQVPNVNGLAEGERLIPNLLTSFVKLASTSGTVSCISSSK